MSDKQSVGQASFPARRMLRCVTQRRRPYPLDIIQLHCANKPPAQPCPDLDSLDTGATNANDIPVDVRSVQPSANYKMIACQALMESQQNC